MGDSSADDSRDFVLRLDEASRLMSFGATTNPDIEFIDSGGTVTVKPSLPYPYGD